MQDDIEGREKWVCWETDSFEAFWIHSMLKKLQVSPRHAAGGFYSQLEEKKKKQL